FTPPWAMAGAQAKPAAAATIPAVSIAANAIRPDASFACMPLSFVPPSNLRSHAPWLLPHPSLPVPYHRPTDLVAPGSRWQPAGQPMAFLGDRSARLSSGPLG